MNYSLYGGEVSLNFDEDKHTYYVSDRKAGFEGFVPSVTGILGIINKPYLMPWAAKMTSEYIQSKWEAGKIYDEILIKTICDEAKGAYKRYSKEATNIGSLTHSWVEQFIKTNLVPDFPINTEARKGCENFLQFCAEHHTEFIESERKIYSRKYRYAGTMDMIARVNDKLTVGDVKTSSYFSQDMFFQTAAYWQAIKEETKDKVKQMLIIMCHKEGELETFFSKDFNGAIKAFLACKTIYDSQQKDKK